MFCFWQEAHTQIPAWLSPDTVLNPHVPGPSIDPTVFNSFKFSASFSTMKMKDTWKKT